MNIYSAQQIRYWDQYTINQEPIASIDLMERAAHAVVEALLHSKYINKTFYIFCGPGNNGGDGLAVARIMHQLKWNVKVYLLQAENYSPDCRTNLQLLNAAGIQVVEIDGAEEFPIIPKEALIIDALFGTGLSRPHNGLASMLIEHINYHQGKIIAIDMPSGLYADKSSIGNIVVKATTTLSFQVPKLAFLMSENAAYVGEWHIIDIGLHPHFQQQTNAAFELLEEGFIKSLIKTKQKFSHKYSYGHALLYAGSPGMYGAGILCAKACFKSGVGLVSILTEEKYLGIFQTTLPEAICIIDWNAENNFTKKTAIGIGPGWAHTELYMHVGKMAILQGKLPVVLDAAALQILANEVIRNQLPPNTIITPHTGEFEKLFGKSNNDFERMELAILKAKELHIYIVLKGAHTIIATPDGITYFNNTGNPGMAKGGSGDVLTGLLTGLLAQGYSPLHTCLLGVYLHGVAGDLATEAHTQYAMTAMDIVDNLGKGWNQLISG